MAVALSQILTKKFVWKSPQDKVSFAREGYTALFLFSLCITMLGSYFKTGLLQLI
jgi:hypothetical protein